MEITTKSSGKLWCRWQYLVWRHPLFATISSGITDENESVKATLITILHEAYKLNPDFITNSNGYNITTELGSKAGD
jgi:hypothetical protein